MVFVDVLYRINKVLMTLKNCQICYQVESDTLNYFYKTVFQIKNDVAVKFEFEVKEFFFGFLGVFKIFFLIFACFMWKGLCP